MFKAMFIFRKKEGPVAFNLEEDPILRVVPSYDGGSTICTRSGAKEYVMESVSEVLIRIGARTSPIPTFNPNGTAPCLS